MLGKLISFEGGECGGKGTHSDLASEALENKGYKVNNSFWEPGSTPKSELLRIVLKNKYDTKDKFEFPEKVLENFDLEGSKEFFSKDKISNTCESYLSKALELSDNPIKNEIIKFILTNELPGDSVIKKTMNKLNKEGLKSEALFEHYLTKEELSSKAQECLMFSARNILYHNYIHKSLREYDFTFNDRSGDSTIVYQGYALLNPSTPKQEVNKIKEGIRKENMNAMEGINPDLTILLDISVNEIFERLKNTSRGGYADYYDGKKRGFHERVRQAYHDEVKYYESLPKQNPQHGRIKIVNTEGLEIGEAHKKVLKTITSYFSI